jgi:peptidoglycan hydrolase-like protein with peptidoglycan-binding domain
MGTHRTAFRLAVALAGLIVSAVAADARSVGNPDCRERQYGINLVVELKKALKAEGFLKGPVTDGELLRNGEPPPEVARAIEAYRRSKGLPVSGRIDPELLQMLLGSRFPLAHMRELGEVCDDLARQRDDAGAEP